MSDVYEHNQGDHEDPLAGPTLLVSVLGAIALLAIFFMLTAIYYNSKSRQVETQVVALEREEVRDLYRRQEQVLQGRGWQTRDEGGQEIRAFVIPIERAMELVVEEAN